eukprot:GHVS01104088.1.p1 GENE.GHVS01104088.1~~GHVS01104088.1.p1  ORF type:complete len:307 (+),score=53.75 GHVS01104088.1:134-1054(+)
MPHSCSPARSEAHNSVERRPHFEASPLFLHLLFVLLSFSHLLPLVFCQPTTLSSQQRSLRPPASSADALFPITTSLETLNASSRLRQSKSPPASLHYAVPPPADRPVGAAVASRASPPPPEPALTQESLAISLPSETRGAPPPRRWYPKAQEATDYLQGMAAPEVAEIIKLTRTGNPIYDGITSVMTVADFGLRQRQGKLHEEATDGVKVEESAGNGGVVRVERGVKLKGIKERGEGSLGGKKGTVRKREHLGSEGIDWQAFRKVVVDEAMNQYFADRQWFMQEILAPAFAEDINAAVQRVAEASK